LLFLFIINKNNISASIGASASPSLSNISQIVLENLWSKFNVNSSTVTLQVAPVLLPRHAGKEKKTICTLLEAHVFTPSF
jgi:hypothetical protein